MKIFTLSLLFLCIAGWQLSAQPLFNWSSQEIKAGRNLQKMTTFNNEAVIAGFGRTFVKSNDQGATWTDIGILVPQFDLIDLSFKGNTGMAAVNRAKLYDAFPDVYTNGTLLLTTDGGATWKNVDLTNLGSGDDPATDPTAITSFGLDFQSVGVANDSVAYCYLRWMEYKPTESSGYVTHGAIFKTTNKGVNWKILGGDLGSNIVTTFAIYDTTCYIGGLKMLYKTSTKSEVLTDIFSKLNASAAYVSDIHIVSKDEIYLSTTTSGVFKSTDGGQNFTKFTISGVTGGWDILKVGTNTLVLGAGASKSRVSNDGGATWLDCLIATSIWEVAGVLNDSLCLLAKSEIYKIALTDLTAGTFTWKKQVVSQDNNLQKAHIPDANKMMVVGNGQTFKMTADKGKTWTNMTFPAVPVMDENIDFIGLRSIDSTAYACFNRIMFADYPSTSASHDVYWSGGIFKTTNNWKTFTNLDAALIGKNEGTDVSRNPQLPACNGLNTSVIEYLGNDVILLWARWYDVSGAAKVEHSRIFKSSDAGKNWKVVSDDFLNVYVMDIKFKGNTGYAVGNKIFLKSTDGGETFTNIYGNLDTGDDDAMFINSVTIGEGNEIFVVTVADGNYVSTDAGATFTKISTATGANDFYRFDVNSWMFLGTTGKSMFTNDAGATWLNCHPAATIYEIGGVWGDHFYALGQGKVYRLPVADLQLKTGVTITPDGNGVLVHYRPSSVLLVSPGEKLEECRIYNTLGALVSVRKPQSTSFEINNGTFAPGVYIVKSASGGKIHTSKIFLK